MKNRENFGGVGVGVGGSAVTGVGRLAGLLKLLLRRLASLDFSRSWDLCYIHPNAMTAPKHARR
jgi:hypothetical protein